MNHRLVLGTMTFGSQLDEAESLRLIDAALDYGISFLDTANVYNMGHSEEIVAKALHGRRSRIRLATKVRGKMGDAPDDIKVYGPSTPAVARFRQRIEYGSLWSFGVKGTF